MDEEKQEEKSDGKTETGQAETESVLNTVARAVGSTLGAVAAKTASVVESATAFHQAGKPKRREMAMKVLRSKLDELERGKKGAETEKLKASKAGARKPAKKARAKVRQSTKSGSQSGSVKPARSKAAIKRKSRPSKAGKRPR